MEIAVQPGEDANGTSESGSAGLPGDVPASRVVSFREKSTYRRDPEYSASGVRQYVNDQLYPHLLAAMQAINVHRPLHPVLFLARCLLEGSAPDDEPTASACLNHTPNLNVPCSRRVSVLGTLTGGSPGLRLQAMRLRARRCLAIRCRVRSKTRSQRVLRRSRDHQIQYVHATISPQHAAVAGCSVHGIR